LAWGASAFRHPSGKCILSDRVFKKGFIGQWNTRTVQAQIDEVQPDLLEAACIAAHNAYEQAAHEAGWVTNTQSRKPWADVPEANKIATRAGIAAAIALIRKGDQP